MNRFSVILALFGAIFLLCGQIPAQSIKEPVKQVNTDDLEKVLGRWSGTLTYIDYGSGEPFSMPTDLLVNKGKSDNVLFLEHRYPSEPQADSKEKLKVSKNGQKIDRHRVSSIERRGDGETLIVTQGSGRDDRKRAEIRKVYLLSKDDFNILKEVKYQDSDAWIRRSEFSYRRMR